MIRSVLLGAAMVAAPAFAQSVSGPERVIQDQFNAFEARDVARAFEYASPMIRSMFGTAENFGTMVETGYPMVWSPAQVRFGGVRQDGPFAVKTVIVTDQSGAIHVLEYQMLESDGGWKINGVRLMSASSFGA